MDEKTQTRERILDAAVSRIKHYGYGKTTMAEIASDCGMSPGNIYRFFEAKIDLAEAMARHHYAAHQQVFADLANDRSRSPVERLREVFTLRMRENFELVEENAKILEVAEVLQKERPLFMNEQLALERIHIGNLLQQGAEVGVFSRFEDYDYIAEMIQAATVKFGFPHLFSKLTLDKLERELNGVLDLLLTGLLAKPHDG